METREVARESLVEMEGREVEEREDTAGTMAFRGFYWWSFPRMV